LAKKSSLEAFYKSLLRYIRIQCLDLDPIALEDPLDFNAIAEHGDAEQTIKVATYESKLEFGITDICVQLLTILLLAAVHGTNKEKYVQAITRLDLESQAEIASIIQKVGTRNLMLQTLANIPIRLYQV
jgi:protein HOOK3